MSSFTDIDKAIMNKIAAFDTDSPRIFGAELCEILFNTENFGVFISNLHGSGYACELLALSDGGRSRHRARAAIVELISLMDFLEENRYILIADGPSIQDSLLLFDKEDYHIDCTYPKTARIICRQPHHHIVENSYKQEITAHTAVSIKERVKDGHREAMSASLILPSGQTLSNAGYGYNLKDRLLRLLTSHIYPTLKLKEFISRDYRTESQYFSEEALDKAELQVKRGTQAVVIAVISVLLTIVFQLWDPSCTATKEMLLLLVLSIFFMLGYLMNEKEDTSNSN